MYVVFSSKLSQIIWKIQTQLNMNSTIIISCVPADLGIREWQVHLWEGLWGKYLPWRIKALTYLGNDPLLTGGLRQLHTHCDPFGSCQLQVYARTYVVLVFFKLCLPNPHGIVHKCSQSFSETLQEILQMSLLTAMSCIFFRNTILTSSDSECSTEPLLWNFKALRAI